MKNKELKTLEDMKCKKCIMGIDYKNQAMTYFCKHKIIMEIKDERT